MELEATSGRLQSRTTGTVIEAEGMSDVEAFCAAVPNRSSSPIPPPRPEALSLPTKDKSKSASHQTTVMVTGFGHDRRSA